MSGPSAELLLLLRKIRKLSDHDGYEALMADLASPAGPTVVSFVNAHAVNLCWSRPDVMRDFARSDVLLRDGRGLEILFEAMDQRPGLNLNGTDLIPVFLSRVAGRRVGVFGTAEPWLSRGCAILEAQGHQIVARSDGFQLSSVYLDLVRASKPEIIILAMGMPRQERIAQLLKSALPNYKMTIICGGAIVDFIAGRVRRAPVWMRRAGFEWLYRLFHEPRRLFRRYVIGNAVFLYRVRQIKRFAGQTAIW